MLEVPLIPTKAPSTATAHTPTMGGANGTTERYYVSDSSESNIYKYCLPADEKERERLNLQSEMISLTFENKLIWAPTTLKEGDIVIDSGTGSGHWLLSLAKQVPSTVVLRGIDISPRMWPLPTLTPPNALFMPFSITSLPEDWSNTVTLIHQRLLMVALQADQWKAAISEMYRVLKPGGWVQLFEPNGWLISPLGAAISHHKAMKVRDVLSVDLRHVVMDIADHLQDWLEEAGFVNLTMQKRDMPMGSWAGERGTLSMKATLGSLEAMKPLVMKHGGLGVVSSEEEYDAVLADLAQLCDDTPETYFRYWVFTAQKPLPSNGTSHTQD